MSCFFYSSANFLIEENGSFPGLKMNMIGVKGVVSSKRYSIEKGGRSMYSYPSSDLTKERIAGIRSSGVSTLKISSLYILVYIVESLKGCGRFSVNCSKSNISVVSKFELTKFIHVSGSSFIYILRSSKIPRPEAADKSFQILESKPRGFVRDSPSYEVTPLIRNFHSS